MLTSQSTDERWWDQRRFGLLVQLSTAAVPAWAPVGQYAEWYRAHLEGDVPDTLLHPSPMVETIAHHRDRWAHVEHYDDFLEFLTFEEFDPDAWAALAGAAGMSYTVMVAKHHDGLCWWDAPSTDHTVLAVGPRRNVLAEYSEACQRAGLTLGTYYSLLDWSDPRYPSCEYVEQVVHPHVLDLVERYGTRMLWGDGHWGGGGSHWRSDELINLARRRNPSLVINDRWWSDGPSVRTFEYRVPPGIVDSPWEMRRGLGGSFGYNRAERPEHLLTPHAIVALLTHVVAKGGHLLLGLGPDASGRVPELQCDVLRAAGVWVQRHADLVNRSQPWQTWGDENVRYLVLDGDVHAIDLTGAGRFAGLGRAAGIVRSVSRAGDGSDTTPVDFEQEDGGLSIVHRGRFDRAVTSDAVDVAVYRIALEPNPPPPIELFPPVAPSPIELAGVLAGARAGTIVQLGDGTYVGPARVPDGVTLRGLGPGRTVIDGLDTHAVSIGRTARLEHCSIRGGGQRIVWLPRVAVVMAGTGGTVLGCSVDGHVEIAADECRITSCTLVGVVAKAVDHVVISRSTFTGMNWDCAVEIELGTGHLIESCDFRDVLDAVRLTGTVGATVRGNRVDARWWGVRAIDTEATLVVGNAIGHATRAVDIDGGTLAEITGNAVADGDSGCVIQRGASDTTVSGNRWERCRTGLLAWDAGAVRQHANAVVDAADPDHAVVVGP